jgi:hypothetical protein
VAFSLLAAASIGFAPAAFAGHHHRGHHGCADCGHDARHHDCACPGCLSGGGGSAAVQGAGERSGGGAAVQGAGQRSNYDVDTVTTLRGTVAAVTVIPARRGRSGGLQVTVETDGKATDVHLGPSWFLERQGLALAKGNAVEVTGSLVEQDGTTFLIAREVAKGDKRVTLRDQRGIPAWSGGPR